MTSLGALLLSAVGITPSDESGLRERLKVEPHGIYEVRLEKGLVFTDQNRHTVDVRYSMSRGSSIETVRFDEHTTFGDIGFSTLTKQGRRIRIEYDALKSYEFVQPSLSP